MTREERENAIRCLKLWIEREPYIQTYKTCLEALEQEPKTDRLYSWLNDMRLGIAPDETVTDIDERNVRIAQTDLLDEIMEWLDKNGQEPKTIQEKGE